VARAEAGDMTEECQPLDDSEEARAAAALVNEFTRRGHDLLDRDPVNQRRRAAGKMPGNLILVRDAGDHRPTMPSIEERFGVRFGCFVEMPVERGIAQLTGMEVIPVPVSGEDKAGVYQRWAETAVERIRGLGGLYIHTKGPDEPGHDGKPDAKRAIIELIDRVFFGALLPRITLDAVLIAVTADHATPCALRSHSDDPVPLLLAGAGVASDGGPGFGETVCARGSLGTLKGVDVMPLLVQTAKG
jgi:2,3-bisphosphoglycerate-independent phosphoglycerate mutase